MTHWSEYSAADFDRSRARKGTRQRSPEPGLFHLATPVERPANSKPEQDKHVDGDVALFDLTGDDTQ